MEKANSLFAPSTVVGVNGQDSSRTSETAWISKDDPVARKVFSKACEMTGKQLAASMVIATMQEFEHNISQQLYVSYTLWKILLTVKDQTLDIITQASNGLTPTSSADDLMKNIDQAIFKIGSLPTENGKQAIKREAGL
jgi:hypothetical protein